MDLNGALLLFTAAAGAQPSIPRPSDEPVSARGVRPLSEPYPVQDYSGAVGRARDATHHATPACVRAHGARSYGAGGGRQIRPGIWRAFVRLTSAGYLRGVSMRTWRAGGRPRRGTLRTWRAGARACGRGVRPRGRARRLLRSALEPEQPLRLLAMLRPRTLPPPSPPWLHVLWPRWPSS